ncbi:hypothetical protein ABZT17_14865 [Streptomyces sp. NPDC005648]|uniref:hypothetical protein n=1 Tax=Streptomyces sp. NPDC005648 TaxID=3157044 RepID=UPI0033A50FED
MARRQTRTMAAMAAMEAMERSRGRPARDMTRDMTRARTGSTSTVIRCATIDGFAALTW